MPQDIVSSQSHEPFPNYYGGMGRGYTQAVQRARLTFSCSKLTIETLEKGVVIVNFEHISPHFLVSLLLILNK